jgi:hypothetical protein
MMPVSSANIALQILQQSDAVGRAQNPGAVGQASQPTPSPRTDWFGVNSQSLTQLKVDLYRRVGEALGIDQSDYDSPRDYGMALQRAIGQLKLSPNAQLVIAGIEKEVGLDKLGVSLDTVVSAITDPSGTDDDKLDAALEKRFGVDDAGLYGPGVLRQRVPSQAMPR